MMTALAIALGLFAGCVTLDGVYTVRGLSKRLSEEANRWIVFTQEKLGLVKGSVIYFALEYAAFALPLLLLPHTALFLGANIGAMVGMGVKHLIGAWEWKRLGA